MADNRNQIWEEIARTFDDYTPPLRPCPEDLNVVQRAILQWREKNHADPVRVFLCGVTPEVANMHWPFPIKLIAMDRNEGMVHRVWPGDVDGIREAFVGNWLDSGLPKHSQDIVIGDGGFATFDFPGGHRALATALHRLLQPGGLIVYRHFAQAAKREELSDVVNAMRQGAIGNFHTFKWRVAMALQTESSVGVKMHDIWQACTEARIDPARLPQPGWSPRAIDTLRFYRDKEERYYFPTLDEFRDLLTENFQDTSVRLPKYELGDRCPILTARPRGET